MNRDAEGPSSGLSFFNAQAAGDLRIMRAGTSDAMTTVLAERFEANTLFTWIGEAVLISVNPFADLGLASDTIMSQYRRHRKQYSSTRPQQQALSHQQASLQDTLPPHVFAVAERSWQLMRKVGDQIILCTGQTGAGKSEVTRMILRYLATGTPWQQLKRTSEPENLCFAMVALDSFGTACVGRNHRSTRFTALYDLIYDTRNLPVGGHIDVAFLEASSIAADNVSTFNIFYEMLAGATDEQMRTLLLPSRTFKDYRYTRTSFRYMTDKDMLATSAKAFGRVQDTLNTIGLQLYQIDFFNLMLAVILHLGEIAVPFDARDPPLQAAARLLAVDAAALARSLHKASGGVDSTDGPPLLEEDGRRTVDALATLLYERLFRQLCVWINMMIKPASKISARTIRARIGVIDSMSGDRSEETCLAVVNGYEELCAHYSEERMHHLCQALTIGAEQKLHTREGVPWEYHEYNDNIGVCQVMEKIVFPLLSLQDHDSFGAALVDSPAGQHGVVGINEDDPDNFFIEHYSGESLYNIDEVLAKSRPLSRRLDAPLRKVLEQSSDDMVANLFVVGGEASVKGAIETAATISEDPSGSDVVVPNEDDDMYPTRAMQRIITKSGRRTAHVVRCLLSNAKFQAMHYDDEIMQKQIKQYDLPSLLAVCRQRQARYELRFPYSVFIRRYKMTCPDTWPRHEHLQDIEVATLIVRNAGMERTEFALGSSMVFLLSTAKLDFLRNASLHRIAMQLQRFMRMARVRLSFLWTRDAAITIQRWWSKVYARNKLRWWRKAFVTWVAWTWRGTMEQLPSKWNLTEDDLRMIKANSRADRAAVTIQRMYRRELATRVCMVIRRSYLSAPRTGVVGGTCYTVVGWPIADIPWVEKSVEIIKNIFRRWCNLKYRQQIRPDTLKFMKLKSYAEDLFRGKKALYSDSINKPFSEVKLDFSEHKNKQAWDDICKKEQV